MLGCYHTPAPAPAGPRSGQRRKAPLDVVRVQAFPWVYRGRAITQ